MAALAVALVEWAFLKALERSVDLGIGRAYRRSSSLFGEDASRVIDLLRPENFSRIKQVAAKYSLSADVIGQTDSDKVEIRWMGG